MCYNIVVSLPHECLLRLPSVRRHSRFELTNEVDVLHVTSSADASNRLHPSARVAQTLAVFLFHIAVPPKEILLAHYPF